jgi:hypothetical protein
MNPTKAQKIKSLKIARAKIKSGEHEYICIALHKTPAHDYLRKYISSLLSPYSSYENWLNKYHIPFSKQTPMLIKKGRLQWIDWMIKNAT